MTLFLLVDGVRVGINTWTFGLKFDFVNARFKKVILIVFFIALSCFVFVQYNIDIIS